MASNFLVGSIEEDFKKIGLIPEIVVENVSLAAEVLPAEVSTPKVAAAVDAPASPPAATEPVEAPKTEAAAETTEGLKLLRKKRPTGKLRMQRRKQTLMRRRNKGKLKLKARKFRRSAAGRRFLQKYKRAMKRFHGHAPKGKRLSLKTGLDRVSNMLEEVQEIVSAIDSNERQETIKSFANLALIANTLAENYAYACENFEVEDENDEELDLCGGAEHFEALADSAANLAEALNKSVQEGTEFEGTSEEVAETFSVMLADVLEGLDLFADLTEDEVDEDAEETDEALRTRTVKDVGPLAGDPDPETEASEKEVDPDDVEKDNDDDDADDDGTDDDDSDDDDADDDEDEKEAGKKARPTK